MTLAVLKQKKVYIPAIIIVIVGLLWYRSYQKSHQPPSYDTIKTERGQLLQTVDATGKIESVNDLSLRFEMPGTLTNIAVQDNSVVKKGQLLANLRLSELNAAVAQASANLRQKLAGATDQDRQYYQAAMDSAKASWDQSKIDAENSVRTAEANVQTAKNNLQLAEGGENSQIVTKAYQDAVAAIQTSLVKLDDALVQADTILGVDNTSANDSFETYLSPSNPNKILQAKDAYSKTKNQTAQIHTLALTLTSMSPHATIESTLTACETGLSLSIQMLTSVSDVLQNTQAAGTLTTADLSAKQTTVSTARSANATQYTAVIQSEQALISAKNSYNNYSIAYQKAQQDLESARSNAVTSVTLKEAAYNQAFANYQTRILPPREVDVAYYRATLSQAAAARDKAIIRAPIDGIVTKVNKKVGESVSSVDVAIQMLSPHFEVKVDIPETDISKIHLGNTTTISLDAFGDETKFEGTILNIEPGSTEIQDVVYYKVTVALVDTDKPIKSGMTANISVLTDSRDNVIAVPTRAIRTRDDGTKYVRVLTGTTEKEVTVKVGLRGDGAKTEILEGLDVGQEVIIGTKS